MKSFVKFLGMILVICLSFVLILSFFLFVYSFPATFRLPKDDKTTIMENITTVDDAIKYLKNSNLTGWALVEKAQMIVTQKMEYSRRNGFDNPNKAFQRGMGYCLQ
ncbi:MAG TPA: hypothetical protein PK771_05475 [Spirochaetota bacterium]|nr:hypothetical protein [Spirochaetota bacterium]